MVVTIAKYLCKKRLSLRYLALVLSLFGVSTASLAQTEQPTLLMAWLSQPSLTERPAPYQYMRSATVAEHAAGLQQALLQEFDDLSWRLESAGYAQLNTTVEAWRARINDLTSFRSPGLWGPAALMAYPTKMPPFERVAAIGACLMPDWVEVWDRHGVRRVDWRQAQSLSDLLRNADLDVGKVGRAIVVRPEGTVQSYGAQAWNFHDTSITPGSRVVAALPLKGEAFAWIQETTADVLAHAPSGVDCKEAALVQQDD